MISAEKTNAPATRDGPHPRDTMVQSLQRELDGLKAEGLYRWLRQIDGPQGPRVHVDGREAIHFAGSDYLGLACHPRLKKAACQATLRYGCGVAAARLISGNHELYPQLEERLARFKQAEAALLFGTGYQANLGVLSALMDSPDVVFSDALNHASIVDGCRLSRATIRIFPHNDIAALTRLLEQGHARLHQPPRQQAALPVGMPAVAIAQLLGLGRKVEGFAHARGVEHREDFVVIGVEP